MCGHLRAFRSTCRKINLQKMYSKEQNDMKEGYITRGSGVGDDPACLTQQLRNQNRTNSK